MPSFRRRLLAASEANQSLLCIGLDPDPEHMAIPDILEFNKTIVDSTYDQVCAYKPNLGFYEPFGSSGIMALEETVSYIRKKAPHVVIIGDGKRGDIGSTNTRYATALFDTWGFDAATINCYAGSDALEPFLQYEDKGVIVWCRSSNPGAGELQDILVSTEVPVPYYQAVANRILEWDRRGNLGIVAGATFPQDLAAVRSICPNIPILVPALGSQGGDLHDSVKLSVDKNGRNAILSSSRSVLYASESPTEFGDAARKSASAMRETINSILVENNLGW